MILDFSANLPYTDNVTAKFVVCPIVRGDFYFRPSSPTIEFTAPRHIGSNLAVRSAPMVAGLYHFINRNKTRQRPCIASALETSMLKRSINNG